MSSVEKSAAGISAATKSTAFVPSAKTDFARSFGRLLQYLQQLSNDIITKTRVVQNDMEDLGFEAQAADLKLHNCFNQLLMLSNSQFIENVRLLHRFASYACIAACV